MKTLIVCVVFLLSLSFTSRACEIKFNISGEKKEVYKAGEELIVEVTVTYTHRVLELELSDSKFTYEGMKILGLTAGKKSLPEFNYPSGVKFKCFLMGKKRRF
jgi:hypothetical protein